MSGISLVRPRSAARIPLPAGRIPLPVHVLLRSLPLAAASLGDALSLVTDFRQPGFLAMARVASVYVQRSIQDGAGTDAHAAVAQAHPVLKVFHAQLNAGATVVPPGTGAMQFSAADDVDAVRSTDEPSAGSAAVPTEEEVRVPERNVGMKVIQRVVRSHPRDGDVAQFRIKASNPLRKLMSACCDRYGLQLSQVHFLVGGEVIAPDDTAESLGLKDCDLIDLVGLQAGRETAGKATDKILVIIQDYQGARFAQVMIEKLAPLRRLMDLYCWNICALPSHASFSFEDVANRPDDTAEQLGLQDEDVIAMVVVQAQV